MNIKDNSKIVIKTKNNDLERLVVLKYYLDRKGMNIHHASARLWKNPPSLCMAADIYKVLEQEGIIESGDGMLVEIYLDTFKAYIAIDVCHNDIGFDFEESTQKNPGILSVRLTDINIDLDVKAPTSEPKPAKHCSMGPLGLFVFATNVGYETSSLMSELMGGSFVSESYVLTWAPYAICVSGLLLLLCGMWEVTRNNVYGATAFSAFGCFWLSNGLKLYTEAYFPAQIDPDLLTTPDPWGGFIRRLFILGFVLNLLYQTFALNKISTILISFLSCNVFFAMVGIFAPVCRWFQLIFGWLTTAMALYSFTVQFTNEIYHRKVFNIFPWTIDSPNEVFAAAARSSALHANISKLRTAGKTKNHLEIRAASKSFE